MQHFGYVMVCFCYVHVIIIHVFLNKFRRRAHLLFYYYHVHREEKPLPATYLPNGRAYRVVIGHFKKLNTNTSEQCAVTKGIRQKALLASLHIW